MINRINAFAPIGILHLFFLIGLNTWAQEKSPEIVEDFKPASTNQMGRAVLPRRQEKSFGCR